MKLLSIHSTVSINYIMLYGKRRISDNVGLYDTLSEHYNITAYLCAN